MKFELSLQIFEKFSNIKFHENTSIGIRVVPCGRKDGQTDRRTDMKKIKSIGGSFQHVSNFLVL